MHLQKIIFGILIVACSTQAMAQTNTYVQPKPKKKHQFAFYGGFGPNYYFNNLVLGKNLVNDFNYSFVGRFMWEPEHLLSLGIETGYFRLYTLNAPAPDQVHIANSAIPLQLVVSMKFLRTFYFNFAMGQSVLLNKVTSQSFGDFNATKLSVADFSTTIGYRYRFPSRFSIGAEAKGFYSSSFTDRNVALFFVGGYKF